MRDELLSEASDPVSSLSGLNSGPLHSKAGFQIRGVKETTRIVFLKLNKKKYKQGESYPDPISKVKKVFKKICFAF